MGAGAGPASRAARVEARDARALRRSWAQLIKRIYEADPLVCPNCGGEMRIIAFIIQALTYDVSTRHGPIPGGGEMAPIPSLYKIISECPVPFGGVNAGLPRTSAAGTLSR